MNKLILLTILYSGLVSSAEIDFNFNSPSFSGVGYSSHALTIYQLENQAKTANKAAEEAIKAQAEAKVASSPEAQFLSNLQSRIYSQLAQQITDSLYGSNGNAPACSVSNSSSSSPCGSIDMGNNNISWYVTNVSGQNMIDIMIYTPGQSTTNLQVPIGAFYF